MIYWSCRPLFMLISIKIYDENIPFSFFNFLCFLKHFYLNLHYSQLLGIIPLLLLWLLVLINILLLSNKLILNKVIEIGFFDSFYINEKTNNINIYYLTAVKQKTLNIIYCYFIATVMFFVKQQIQLFKLML
jgi:hypothetical protein